MKITFVWMPRYYDNTCLLSTRAVNNGKNYIAFSCDPKLNHYYSIDAEVIKKCPIQKNGKGSVYIIPINEFTDEGLIPPDQLSRKHQSELEYIEWKNRRNKFK